MKRIVINNYTEEGGVKTAVWEDPKLASPHNEGTCRPVVKNTDTQGDGRDMMGGQRGGGEVEARQDRSP